MAMRSADAAAIGRASLILRRASRYFSDGKSGRVLGEEEKAAENIFIQIGFRMRRGWEKMWSIVNAAGEDLLSLLSVNLGGQRDWALWKTEREKLEKLAQKGYKPEEKPTSTPEAAEATAKPSDPSTSSSGVSTDKHRNYAVVAGVVAAGAALGWYLKSNTKKPEVQD